MEINLYSGIDSVAQLGDTEAQVLSRARSKPEIETSTPEAQAQGFQQIFNFRELGVRVYFRTGYVALIEVQEPFKGSIVGKKLRLFTFTLPPGESWEAVLVKELGTPQNRAEGGRLGSNALMYAWGDIAFNRMGPNELALYRESNAAKFREKNFGRVVRFFGEP